MAAAAAAADVACRSALAAPALRERAKWSCRCRLGHRSTLQGHSENQGCYHSNLNAGEYCMKRSLAFGNLLWHSNAFQQACQVSVANGFRSCKPSMACGVTLQEKVLGCSSFVIFIHSIITESTVCVLEQPDQLHHVSHRMMAESAEIEPVPTSLKDDFLESVCCTLLASCQLRCEVPGHALLCMRPRIGTARRNCHLNSASHGNMKTINNVGHHDHDAKTVPANP